MNDKKLTAKQRYKKKVEILRVELYPTDEDIKKQLAKKQYAGEPKATYIKRLIRQDIMRDEDLERVAELFGLPAEVLKKENT